MALELSKTIKAQITNFDRDKVNLTLTATLAKCDDFASQVGHSVVFMCDGVENPIVVPLENGIAQAKVVIPRNQFVHVGPVIHFTTKLTANGDEVSGSIDMPIQIQEVKDGLQIGILEFLNVVLVCFVWALTPSFGHKFGLIVAIDWFLVCVWIGWNVQQGKMDMQKAATWALVHTFISASAFVISIVFGNLANS